MKIEYKYPIDPDYKTATHYRPQNPNDVSPVCGNGSAHIAETTWPEYVTCEKCRELISKK